MTRNLMKSPPFLLTVCLVSLSLPLVTTHLAAYPAGMIVWLIDLASHWQWLFMLGLIYSCMIAMRKNIRSGIVLFALPLPWLTASQPAPSAGKGTPSPEKILSIATANVHLDNRSAKALGQWIDQVSRRVGTERGFACIRARAGTHQGLSLSVLTPKRWPLWHRTPFAFSALGNTGHPKRKWKHPCRGTDHLGYDVGCANGHSSDATHFAGGAQHPQSSTSRC